MRVLAGLLISAVWCLAQSNPHIAAVVSGADFSQGVTFSGYATIFGTGLSDAAYKAQAVPYPQQLGPTQVFVCYSAPVPIDQVPNIVSFLGCSPASLAYASPSQINFVMPASLPPANLVGLNSGVYSFIVSVGGVLDQDASAATPKTYGLQPPQPRIFFEGYDCFVDPRFQDANKNCGLTLTQGPTYQAWRGAVTDQQGRLLTSSNLARLGQYYTIWMTGLGAFTNGKPNVPLSMALTNIPAYAAGGRLLPGDSGPAVVYPSYVGASTVYPGLYQVNFQLLAPVNYDGPANAYPCGQYNWEFSISIAQDPTLVQIPILVMPGDVPCGQ